MDLITFIVHSFFSKSTIKIFFLDSTTEWSYGLAVNHLRARSLHHSAEFCIFFSGFVVPCFSLFQGHIKNVINVRNESDGEPGNPFAWILDLKRKIHISTFPFHVESCRGCAVAVVIPRGLKEIQESYLYLLCKYDYKSFQMQLHTKSHKTCATFLQLIYPLAGNSFPNLDSRILPPISCHRFP